MFCIHSQIYVYVSICICIYDVSIYIFNLYLAISIYMYMYIECSLYICVLYVCILYSVCSVCKYTGIIICLYGYILHRYILNVYN